MEGCKQISSLLHVFLRAIGSSRRIGIPGIAALLATFTLAAVPDQYQQLLDTKQYKPLLAELNTALGDKSSKATDVDRYSLLMLKGETLLRTRSTAAAEEAFKAAATATKDDDSAALARATVLLIKHSGGGLYQPRTKTSDNKPQPAIDITEPTSRKDAFAAFCSDLLDTTKPKVAGVDAITSLAPIVALARQVGDDRDVEIAATGADAQSKDLLEKLATRAGAMMSDVLKPMDGRIAALTKDAAKKQKALGSKTPAGFFSSLTPDATDELNTMVDNARQVSASAAQMEPIFGGVGDFKTIEADAAKVIEAANKLLTKYHHPAV